MNTYTGPVGVILLASSFALAADPMELPPLNRQPTVRKVVDEHLAALNQCDWKRLMAQYPEDVRLFLPDGVIVKGRAEVGELFQSFCRARPEGLKGLRFTSDSTFLVGNTLNVTWHAEADFLAEPYRGSDAYVTRGGLMAAQVTTFDANKMKFRSGGSQARENAAARDYLAAVATQPRKTK